MAPRRRLQDAAPTVLVVDDDGELRAAIADLLEEHGYQVVQVENGRKAVDHLLGQPLPACLVLDLWMPELDGWSLASEVLQGRLPRVPILLVTAGSSDVPYPVPRRYVLRKPLDPDRLLSRLGELVRGEAPARSR